MWSGDCHIAREKDIVVVYFVCLTVGISHKQYGLYRKNNNKILIFIYKEALNVVLFMYNNKNWNPTWVCSLHTTVHSNVHPHARIVLNCWSSKRSDHTLCQTMFDIIISVKMCCTWTPARGWLNYVCVYPNMLRQHHIITNVYSKPATATTAETAPSIDEPRPESGIKR